MADLLIERLRNLTLAHLYDSVAGVNTYLRNTSQVLTRTDRTLSGRDKLTVNATPDLTQFSDVQGTPAFTLLDRAQVYLNCRHKLFSEVETLDKHVALVLGLNYHELAHVLFTPHLPSNMHTATRWPLMKTLVNQSSRNKYAFNFLEDGRIERLLGALYGATKPFLRLVLVEMARLTVKTGDPVAVQSGWFYIAPRASEIPEKLVAAYREQIKQIGPDRTVSDKTIADSLDIARKYKQMKFDPVNDALLTELIKRYADLLPFDESSADPTGGMVSQHGGMMVAGSAQSSMSSKSGNGTCNVDIQLTAKAQKMADEQDKQQASGESSQQDDRDDEGGDDGESGKSSDETGAGQQSDGKDGEESDGSGAGSEPSDEPGGSAPGGPGQKRAQDKVIDSLQKALDAAEKVALDSDVAVSAISAHRRSLNGHMILSHTAKLKAKQSAPVSDDMRQTAKKIGVELARLRAKLDPGWDRRKESGRLNVQRYMRERDLESAFDVWREDKSDASDIEAVFCLDLSGSMSGHRMVNSAQALWMLRAAFQAIDGKVTCLGFESGDHLLYARDEKVSKSSYDIWGAMGGTSLTTCIEQAAAILMRSRSKAKMLVVISDGAIKDGYEETLADLHNAKVHTSLFGIGYQDGAYRTNATVHYDVVAEVGYTQQIIPVVREVVKGLIKRKGGIS